MNRWVIVENDSERRMKSISTIKVGLLVQPCFDWLRVAERRKKRRHRRLQGDKHGPRKHRNGLRPYTNISNPSSVEEVKALLSAYLDKESVEDFRVCEWYNETVGGNELARDFASFTKTNWENQRALDCKTRHFVERTAASAVCVAEEIRLRFRVLRTVSSYYHDNDTIDRDISF